VSATLHRGFWAGLRVAVAPLLTDAPILGIGLLTLHALPLAALGGIGLAGFVVVFYLLLVGGKIALAAALTILR
jgi:hypothetical protein